MNRTVSSTLNTPLNAVWVNRPIVKIHTDFCPSFQRAPCAPTKICAISLDMRPHI